MKRVLSFFIAFIMLFSVCAVNAAPALSASKAYAEDRLLEIEKTTGFIPGKTAAVVGNCYGFISKVCEKLYGVTYNGEGLYDNYKSKHYSGNFYTVATYTTPHLSPTAQDVEDIISFFTKYAAPGDIIHYGAYDQSKSKTHTFMVQSISNKKMSILHSNYNIAQYSKDSCHVDDIIWESYRENPTKTVKNDDGTLYSINALLYNTMKVGGVGITINRYSKYEDKFYLVGASIPTIKTSRTSPNSIKLLWDEIIGADKYRVQYKKSSQTSYTTLTSDCTALSYDVKGLTVGTTYDFRVAAYIGTKWMEYSDVVAKKALPPTVSSITFKADKSGLKLSWSKRGDITGIRIYRSTSADGSYSKIKTITDNSVGSYIDTSVTYGKSYYYKIERYLKVDSKEYSTTCSPFTGCYTLEAPTVKYENTAANTVVIKLSANGANEAFGYYLTNSKQKNVIALTKTKLSEITLDSLTPGESYTFKCSQTTSFGSSEYNSVTFTAIPKKEAVKKLSVTSKGIKVEYSAAKDVSGYRIYASTQRDKGFSLIGTVSSCDTSSFLHTEAELGTNYYYKVRSFVKSGSENVYSEYSEVAGPVKASLSKPEGLSVSRKTPTSVTVKFKAVKNAESYVIQYKQEGGSWKETTAASTSKVISGLTLGKVYCYRVKAANDLGSGSYCSSLEKKTLPPTPAAPSLKKVSGGVKVSWAAKSWSTGVNVYRATSKSGKYKLIKTFKDNKKTSFTDKEVKNGKTYYYKTVYFVTKSKTDYLSPKSAYSGIKYKK